MDRADDRLDRPYDRLAELVVHLTDCDPERAVGAVRTVLSFEVDDEPDKLAVVARAMIRVLAPAPVLDLREAAPAGAGRSRTADRPQG